MEGCEVAWARRRGTMALMSVEVPETCRVAGAGGEEGAVAGAVAGGAPPRRGAVRWISQPPGAGAGGGTLLTAEVVVEVLESGMGQDEGGGMRELGRPAITERWGWRRRGGRGRMDQPDFRG